MKIVRDKIFESPDNIRLEKDGGFYHGHYYDEKHEPYPFAYVYAGAGKGKFELGKIATGHGSLMIPLTYTICGRVWNKYKIISFWDAPQVIVKSIQDHNENPIDILEDLFSKLKKEGINPKEYKFDTYGWVDHDDYDKPVSYAEFVKELGVKLPEDELQKLETKSKLDFENHLRSPLLKDRKPVPKGWGSNSTKYQELQKQKMHQPFESFDPLNENPNVIIDPEIWRKKKKDVNYTPRKDDNIEFDFPGVIPFGFYGPSKTLLVGRPSDTHYHLLKNAYKKDIIKSGADMKERGSNSGRLFKNQKVLTFWNFPKDYNELMKVIGELEKETGIKMKDDPEWLIELPSGEFKKALVSDKGSWGSWTPRAGHVEYIPFSEYKGGYKRSEEDLGQEHVKSPLLKKKKVFPGWGSNSAKYQELQKQKMYRPFEGYYPRLK